MSDSPNPGYCWHQNPTAAGHCVLNPGHVGNHYDWFTRPSWAGPCAEWPQKAPAR
ncbi:hypothetical protein OG244_23455 [Streptomyces brevispora]|uniref:hypothetical protein n=1 Tax=Streptomyces brevispora TaxID=887462 RepID=UPI002E33242A|nr:hypothetical protein [Streptomyces brevispora]